MSVSQNPLIYKYLGVVRIIDLIAFRFRTQVIINANANKDLKPTIFRKTKIDFVLLSVYFLQSMLFEKVNGYF